MKEKRSKVFNTHVPQLNKPLIKMKNIDNFDGDYLLCRNIFATQRKYFRIL